MRNGDLNDIKVISYQMSIHKINEIRVSSYTLFRHIYIIINDEMSSSVILAAQNINVNEINKTVVSLLDSYNERVYTSVDSADHCDNNGLMGEGIISEYLNSLNPQNLPPHELYLRVNSIVMLIRNISIHEGLCNGTRLRILDLINRIIYSLYSDNEYPFSFKRRQFPIRLAFAMTMNKTQGQTLFNVLILILRAGHRMD